PLLMAIGAVLIFATVLALYGMLACLLAWRLLCNRIRPDPGPTVWAACVWASCWALGEWLRGTLFTGFPWLNIGYAHVEGVLAPWAAVVGVYGVAWLAAFASAAVALMVLGRDTGRDVQAASALALSLLTGIVGIVLSHVV